MNFLWTVHKKHNYKIVIAVQRLYFRWLRFNSNGLIRHYQLALEAGAEAGAKFLVEHKRLIINLYGRQLLQEMILNYNTHFKPSKRLFYVFQRLLKQKSIRHTSDLAIAYNLLRNCNLIEKKQRVVVAFLSERLKHELPKLKYFDGPRAYYVKKRIIMEYLSTRIKSHN